MTDEPYLGPWQNGFYNNKNKQMLQMCHYTNCKFVQIESDKGKNVVVRYYKVQSVKSW